LEKESMSNPFAHKAKEEVLQMWQSRALRAAQGKLGRVLLQGMRKEYIGVTDTSWRTLLGWIFPGYNGQLKYPKLHGYARVELSGRVTCMMLYDGNVMSRTAIYRTKEEFVSEMRKLADAIKLSDVDRAAMFALLGKWITSDLRVGLHGEKLAS
jgi:hypothetical protein